MKNPLFEKLIGHVGHKIEIVTYGPTAEGYHYPVNVAVECEDCGCVLVDADPEIED